MEMRSRGVDDEYIIRMIPRRLFSHARMNRSYPLDAVINDFSGGVHQESSCFITISSAYLFLSEFLIVGVLKGITVGVLKGIDDDKTWISPVNLHNGHKRILIRFIRLRYKNPSLLNCS